ncbi:YbaN family protein [Novosphingobium album (ex Liu et al. 2023)]|uniref:YbaN family protein n=1 Tax=Novosphingobium album (ex Liu et al. 2023) TaxID=3031130 RepID=A0ABT5WTE9_9SPHN|nr:YbaN family protein [Novosphingobium album (ex Liu et al. 2023)]MDE8653082.1 YbaN family protein [Novosphingobium album (ex Liu et al. 2023)]
MRRISRPVWLGAGILAFALGTIGIFLPVMPTVVFYLIAAWCFSRSHPEWADRLHAHPRYGPHLVAWRDRRAISRKGKVSAVLAMSASVPFTGLTLGWPWVLIPIGVLAILGPWIWTRAE